MGNAIKIIVVDDEIGICRNVEKILVRNNFEVTTATSAQEALRAMRKSAFDLVITDIVMPHMNGLELLREVKSQWPQTKALTMTAFASTDTAHRAIRLGALDYLPKPFTPEELRDMVNDALAGNLVEAKISPEEVEIIDLADIETIDVDMPFEPEEVALQTGETYTKILGRGDMPVIEINASEPIEGFCELGAMVCDIFKKLGTTCKAGVKTSACPQLKKKKKAKKQGPDVKSLVGIDLPFNYDEVCAVTGPEYLNYLQHDGIVVPTYETLKANVAKMDAQLAAMADDGTETGRGEAEPSNAADRAPEQSDGAPQTKAPDQDRTLDTGTILIIDDEVAVNNNIRKILNKSEYRVDQATTKDAALEKIDRNAYPLIVLDLKIPGVKGLELLQHINRRQPDAKVIMITGYASLETAKEAARLGAVEYLPKPFTPDEIRAATQRAIRLAA